jgi:acyl-CoA synthetase (AMP-forming)/AMP-acid ligase II
VEAVVKAFPGIVDAVVVGLSDARFGERVAAVVQPVAGSATVALDAVQRHCRDRLAGHKVPRQLVVVDRIPRSPSGKADYPWARAVAEGAPVKATEEKT